MTTLGAMGSGYFASKKRNVDVLAPTASSLEVPQVGAKEERRVLLYASDGLSGKMGCFGAAQRQGDRRSAERRNWIIRPG